MSGDLVPFGKYKGQPVEVMLTDQKYVEWLLTQEWFNDRYASIRTIIINQGSEPAETPEHNMLQAKFLDDEFLHDIMRALEVKARIQFSSENEMCPTLEELALAISERNIFFSNDHTREIVSVGFENKGWDCSFKCSIKKIFECFKFKIFARRLPGFWEDWVNATESPLQLEMKKSAEGKEVDTDVTEEFAFLKGNKDKIDHLYLRYLQWHEAEYRKTGEPRKEFWFKDNQGELYWFQGTESDSETPLSKEELFRVEKRSDATSITVNVEIKPTVSDDYPAILRQITSRKRYLRETSVLLTEAIECKYVTEQQVRKIFEHEKITVLTFQEIEIIKKISEL